MVNSHKIPAEIYPTLGDAARVWLKIGVLSFGGPAAQIALMHKEIVDEREWLTEQQFLEALSFCMLLPGPEAMQLATYAGWRLHGTLGGLIAGLLFIIPGAMIVMILAAIYTIYGNLPLIEALFFGIKSAVLVIVLGALLRVGRKALTQKLHYVIAILAFTGIFCFSIPYPVIVLLAGLSGCVLGKGQKQRHIVSMADVSLRKTSGTIVSWLAIWLVPLFALTWTQSPSLLIELGKFFSSLAVVTFGGAYAVLAYMAQDVVVQFGWLTAGEMVDALGLAETTPGPLILVTQFVGFVAGAREGGLIFGLAAALVTLWVTFVPCFLWIFAGAPYIEWISSQPRLKGALNAITAAVVGVMLNLSIWFALHVLFTTVLNKKFGILTLWQPDFATIELLPLTLFIFSCFLAFRLHWSIIRILIVTSISGVALKLVL